MSRTFFSLLAITLTIGNSPMAFARSPEIPSQCQNKSARKTIQRLDRVISFNTKLLPILRSETKDYIDINRSVPLILARGTLTAARLAGVLYLSVPVSTFGFIPSYGISEARIFLEGFASVVSAIGTFRVIGYLPEQVFNALTHGTTPAKRTALLKTLSLTVTPVTYGQPLPKLLSQIDLKLKSFDGAYRVADQKLREELKPIPNSALYFRILTGIENFYESVLIESASERTGIIMEQLQFASNQRSELLEKCIELH